MTAEEGITAIAGILGHDRPLTVTTEEVVKLVRELPDYDQELKIQSMAEPLRVGLQPHTWRHLFSGTIVFMLGVAVNMGHVYLDKRSSVSVRWQNGETQNQYIRPKTMPTATVEVGICSDGTMTWREK